jgi:hypothetical protein
MGRGLSALQRGIIALAASRRDSGQQRTNGVDLYFHEILIEVLGFPAAQGDDRSPGGRRFMPSHIGRRRFRVARVSLSRAVGRLECRGLVLVLSGVRSHWTGIELTDVGYRMARSLSVDSRDIVPKSQPIEPNG